MKMEPAISKTGQDLQSRKSRKNLLLKPMIHNSRSNRVMEADTISKNGASSKSRMSRTKKVVCLFAVCVAICISVSAQSELTYISLRGIRQDGKTLKTHKQVRAVMSGNDAALKTYNAGMVFNIVGVTTAAPAGFFLGYGLALRALDQEGSGVLLGIGAALLIPPVTFSILSSQKYKKSVQLYNQGLRSNALSYQINFGITQSGGIGVTMRF